MKRRALRLEIIVLAAATLFLLTPPLTNATDNSVEGGYICSTTGGKPCMTNVPLQLVNGHWRWQLYAGTYTVANGKVMFEGRSGEGGPVTWGDAIIGPGTLTFNQFGANSVWAKPSQATERLAPGAYYCHMPSGCMTNQPIVLQADGSYTWGPVRGSYGVVAGEVQFSGITSGPAGVPGSRGFRDPGKCTMQQSSLPGLLDAVSSRRHWGSLPTRDR